MNLSPSKIVSMGLGIPEQQGLPVATKNVVCAACGVGIQSGEPAVTWEPSKGTFTDFQYLVNQSRIICRHCANMITNTTLVRTQMAVVNTNGAWSLSKDAHRVWFMATPPDTPFVAVISDQMKQHLIWRARITHDPNLIHVRLGMADLSIRRPLLLDAVGWCKEAADIARANKIDVTPDHPYVFLDRKRSDLDHARLRDDFRMLAATLSAAGDSRLNDLLLRLKLLGEGELWALSFLAKAKKEAPLMEPLKPLKEKE